jgi:2-amino-4-hydroxy-6-hydroxymethyldihydropteridine diphosphokinase
MTTPIFIALGGNIGDRAARLDAALTRLDDVMTVVARSPVYETAPLYVTDQPAFLNMVVGGRTALAVVALLERLQEIERALGRAPGARNGPRAIDLDILYYGDATIDRPPTLVIPHPRIAERRFVLQPLADIAPAHRDPATGMTVTEMLAALPPSDDVQRWEA